MNREEKTEYTAFVNSLKKQLLKGAVVEVTGLEEKDQRFFDAAKLEPEDGAYCE